MLEKGGCPTLEDLNLSHNRITEDAAYALASWFHTGAGRPSLRSLDLGNNRITGYKFSSRPISGPAKCSLTELDLKGNHIGFGSAAEDVVGAFVTRPDELQRLCISHNKALDGSSLGRILMRHPNIVCLDMVVYKYRYQVGIARSKKHGFVDIFVEYDVETLISRRPP